MKRSLVLGLVVAVLAACAPAASPTLSEPPSVTVSVPQTGVTLRELGFANGPNAAFSIPRDSVITTRIDQVNVVTLFLSAPAADEVIAYLRAALPAAGFTVAADANSALRFSGHGWDGSLVGGKETAITLRRM